MNYFRSILVGLLLTTVSCAQIELTRHNEPISGENVSVYNLADGQVELRLKITGMTSTLWITADLVNRSDLPLAFAPESLLKFVDPSCMGEVDYPSVKSTVVETKSFARLHYTFQLLGKRKNSPEYERCKDTTTRFEVTGLTLGQELVKSIQFTVN